MSEQLTIFQRARVAATPDDPFETWWKEYPRKKDKKAARIAFKKATKHTAFDELLSCVRAFSGRMSGKDEEYIPYAATWLNKERWLDEKPNAQVVDNRKEARLNGLASMIKKRFRTTSLGPSEVREVLAAGLITTEEARYYGV
jgi:hypothetical protein